MKILHLFILLIGLFSCRAEVRQLQPEEIRNKINSLAYSEYPFLSEIDSLSGYDVNFYLTQKEIPQVPFHTYADLSMRQRIRFEDQDRALLYRRLRPQKGEFDILLLTIGWDNAKKTELVTWSPEKGIIDTLEVEVFFSPEETLTLDPCLYKKERQIKECRITEEGKVYVTYIDILENKPQYPDLFNDKIEVQWVENTYQIDKKGKIHLLNQEKQAPQKYYLNSFLENREILPLSENKELKFEHRIKYI